MKVIFTKNFQKQYYNLPIKIQNKFDERLTIWQQDPLAPNLHDHALIGKYQGYRSINITGDIRALYTKKGSTIVIFGFIGSHSQLY